MKLKLFNKGLDVIDNVTGIVDKAVRDKDLAANLNAQIKTAILSQGTNITRWIRGILAIEFVSCWVWFPELFEGRESTAEKIVLGICAFYFLADYARDQLKGRGR